MKRKIAFRRTVVLETEVEIETEETDQDALKDLGLKKLNDSTEWRQRDSTTKWIYNLNDKNELNGFIIGFDMFGDWAS
tara:strand:- start:27 stop:260 length:234 start_codon:yes stop_codon:yes gene_type:complete